MEIESIAINAPTGRLPVDEIGGYLPDLPLTLAASRPVSPIRLPQRRTAAPLLIVRDKF